MSSDLIWRNLVAYSMQVGLLVGLAAFVPAMLRLRAPRGKLLYWQILLAACLLLPMVQTWRQEVVTETIRVTSVISTIQPSGSSAPRRIPAVEIALWVLAAGAAARLIWLAVGFAKLCLYRRRSLAFHSATPWTTRAELRLSEDVASPVTFGVRNPVVLLPSQFPDLDPQTQDAILCHELLHVDRNDWLFTVGEELVRVIFWFHPAIWWLLGEIQLAREQAVDREVIDVTQAREAYVDALLTIAGAGTQGDLAPAPLFLRKRHLKQRVVSILKDGRMSRAAVVSALTAGFGILAIACWLVTSTFPLAASPQIINDGSGIAVDTGGATLLHRTPVRYPEAALAKGVQGTVVVETTLDAKGNVSDARVLSGPEELRRVALESVLGWHYANEGPGARRQVSITFKRTEEEGPSVRVSQPPAAMQRQAQSTGGRLSRAEQEARALAELEKLRQTLAQRAPAAPRTIKTITTAGLSPELHAELLAKLPVRQGDAYTPEAREKVARSIREFDEHMTVAARDLADGTVELQVGMRESSTPNRIRVGGNVQQMALVKQVRPIYPPAAKEVRLQGVVRLTAVIGKDGTVQELQATSGHPLLVPSAIEAVKQWVYKPTLLNATPVEVVTQIDVNYTLSQ